MSILSYFSQKSPYRVSEPCRDDQYGVGTFVPINQFLGLPASISPENLDDIDINALSYSLERLYLETNIPNKNQILLNFGKENLAFWLYKSHNEPDELFLNMQPYNNVIADYYLYWIRERNYKPNASILSQFATTHIDDYKLNELLDAAKAHLSDTEFSHLMGNVLSTLCDACDFYKDKDSQHLQFYKQQHRIDHAPMFLWDWQQYLNTARKIDLILRYPGVDLGCYQANDTFSDQASDPVIKAYIALIGMFDRKSRTLFTLKSAAITDLEKENGVDRHYDRILMEESGFRLESAIYDENNNEVAYNRPDFHEAISNLVSDYKTEWVRLFNEMILERKINPYSVNINANNGEVSLIDYIMSWSRSILGRDNVGEVELTLFKSERQMLFDKDPIEGPEEKHNSELSFII